MSGCLNGRGQSTSVVAVQIYEASHAYSLVIRTERREQAKLPSDIYVVLNASVCKSYQIKIL